MANEQQIAGNEDWQRAQALCLEIIALVTQESDHGVVLSALAGASAGVLTGVLRAYDANFYDTFIGQVKIAMDESMLPIQPITKENKRDRQTKNATKGIPPGPYRHRHSGR